MAAYTREQNIVDVYELITWPGGVERGNPVVLPAVRWVGVIARTVRWDVEPEYGWSDRSNNADKGYRRL